MAVVSDTAKAKKVKGQLEDDLDDKKAARRKRNKEHTKKRKAAKTAAEKAKHAPENGPLEGVLAKGDSYAENGYTYLKGQNGRGVYNKVDPAVTKWERYVFPSTYVSNFNPDYSQQKPYPWDAHHMIPGESFYSELDGATVFSAEARRLILQCPYNVNHGHNMIFLPSADKHGVVHKLPCHPSDHPVYTELIMNKLKKISTSVQKKIDNGEDHKAIEDNVFDRLKGVEEDAWKLLVKLGKAIEKAKHAKAKNKQKYHDPDGLIKWQTKGGKEYVWGALT